MLAKFASRLDENVKERDVARKEITMLEGKVCWKERMLKKILSHNDQDE